MNGYVDFFEPDFLVEAEPNLAKDLGYPQERVLELSSLLASQEEYIGAGNGLSVFDLYRHLYKKQYQFSRLHPRRVAHLTSTRSFDLFCACVFGAFPKDEKIQYFETAFHEAFSPEKISLTEREITEIYKDAFVTPLQIGHAELDIQYDSHADSTLFILDSANAHDLIDYWNLRAIHPRILPVPMQWVDTLSEFCRQFVLDHHVPMRGNQHGIMHQATVTFGRSLPDAVAHNLHETFIKVDKKGANARGRYHEFWRPFSSSVISSSRPILSAKDQSTELNIATDKPGIRFEPLYPKFADRFGGENRWANIVSLNDWSGDDSLTTVSPIEVRDRCYPTFSPGQNILSTTEGYVIFPKYRGLSEYWELRSGGSAISGWLAENGIAASPSDAAAVTEQIVGTLGGFRGVRAIAHSQIVKLLDDLARRSAKKSAHYLEFRGRIEGAVKDDIWLDRSFETLVKKGAVELGLDIRCTRCNTWGWHSLGELAYEINCHLCRRPFGFPITDPMQRDKCKWAYRVVGPFSLDNYARGGYATALTIRLFSKVVAYVSDSKIAWSAGQQMKLPTGRDAEADFVIWYKQQHLGHSARRTDIIFGESKSFGKDAFKEEDVERMRALGSHFPGAFIVFATMKDGAELSRDEIARMSKLALWGRENIEGKSKSRTPVIVLTGTELFSSFSLEQTWKESSDRHKAIVEPSYSRIHNLRHLADATQQLYLNLPSYYEWRRDKYAKAKLRRQKTQV